WPDGRMFKTDQIKTVKNMGRAAEVLLVSDADDEPGTNNWPDERNNHGLDGQNIGFCDRHVAFCRTGRPLLEAYINGYYNINVPQVYARYGLNFSGNKFTWKY